MDTGRLVDHQVPVEAQVSNGQISLRLSTGDTVVWPVSDTSFQPGQFYLTLSPTPVLPSKEELARLILTEILKQND